MKPLLACLAASIAFTASLWCFHPDNVEVIKNLSPKRRVIYRDICMKMNILKRLQESELTREDFEVALREWSKEPR